jgi:CDP-diacylglycerol--serine O-phosphatidyltransferase
MKSEEGVVTKFFEGVPTPLGAILLWVLYLLFSYNIIANAYVIVVFVALIAWALNSKLKIPHP